MEMEWAILFLLVVWGFYRHKRDKVEDKRSPARRRPAPTPVHKVLWRFAVARNASPGQYQAEIGGYPGNVRLKQRFLS
jgi:hypothetical protein